MHSINNNFILSINNIKSKQYNRSSLQVWAVYVLGLWGVSWLRLGQDRLSTFCPPYTAHHLFQKTNPQYYENCKSQKRRISNLYTHVYEVTVMNDPLSSLMLVPHVGTEIPKPKAKWQKSALLSTLRAPLLLQWMNLSHEWINQSSHPASTAIPTTVLSINLRYHTNQQSCKYGAPCHMIGTFGNDFWRALNTCQTCQLRWFTNWLVRSASPRFTYLERLRLYYKSN